MKHVESTLGLSYLLNDLTETAYGSSATWHNQSTTACSFTDIYRRSIVLLSLIYRLIIDVPCSILLLVGTDSGGR